MATVRDLIKGSLRLIGAIASGETPTADEEQDALLALNDMVENWNLEGLMVYTINREEFALVPGQQSYTMGVGGNFNTNRPLRIDQAYMKILNTGPSTELPIDLVTDDEWAAITVKSTTSSIPRKLWNRNDFPLTHLDLWPVPSAANVLVLYTWDQIGAFSSANAAISLPPGYAKALRYNLAVELAPEYGKEPGVVVASIARDSKEDIKRINAVPQYMDVDPALMPAQRTFNWLTGD